MVSGELILWAANEVFALPDIKTSPERACHLAKRAFDDAVLSVDASDAGLNQILRDSMAILQLLRDDLIISFA